MNMTRRLMVEAATRETYAGNWMAYRALLAYLVCSDPLHGGTGGTHDCKRVDRAQKLLPKVYKRHMKMYGYW
jgi:hypothetical protein